MVTAARKQRRRDRWYKRKEQYRQERKYRYRQHERTGAEVPAPAHTWLEDAMGAVKLLALCIRRPLPGT